MGLVASSTTPPSQTLPHLPARRRLPCIPFRSRLLLTLEISPCAQCCAEQSLPFLGSAPPACFLPLIWLKTSASMRVPLPPVRSGCYSTRWHPRAWNTFFMPAAVVLAFSGSAAAFLVSDSHRPQRPSCRLVHGLQTKLL